MLKEFFSWTSLVNGVISFSSREDGRKCMATESWAFRIKTTLACPVHICIMASISLKHWHCFCQHWSIWERGREYHPPNYIYISMNVWRRGPKWESFYMHSWTFSTHWLKQLPPQTTVSHKHGQHRSIRFPCKKPMQPVVLTSLLSTTDAISL